MRKFVGLALAVLCGGCASITRGTTDQLNINSEPMGADVRTSMGATCITPCTLTVGRKDEFTVTVSAPGYRPESVVVGTKVAGTGAVGMAGNVVFGGIIGMGVDAYNGAELDHFPNPVDVTLRPLAPQAAPPSVLRIKPAPRRPGVPEG